jgi:hypothetical protein
MTTNTNEQESPKEDSINFSKGIPNFILKTIIIVFAFVFALNAVIPDIPKIPETQRNKLILLSFIQSPYVLLKLSDFEKDKGNLKDATILMEAAISLMEMHGASEKSIKKYQDKLSELNSN